MVKLVSPLDETARDRGRPATRLEGLSGRRIALLDISKPGGKAFLDRIEALLAAEGVAVLRRTKPTFTRPAPEALVRELGSEGCDAVIEALAD